MAIEYRLTSQSQFQTINLHSFTVLPVNEMFSASHADTPALGDKLDRIRESFRSTCHSLELPPSPDALNRLDIEGNCSDYVAYSFLTLS